MVGRKRHRSVTEAGHLYAEAGASRGAPLSGELHRRLASLVGRPVAVVVPCWSSLRIHRTGSGEPNDDDGGAGCAPGLLGTALSAQFGLREACRSRLGGVFFCPGVSVAVLVEKSGVGGAPFMW